MSMRAIKSTTESPEMVDRFDRVLSDAIEALEESGIKYAFIGGIASGGLGRPRTTRDIDVFVRPEDAESCLRALTKHGFRTEHTDPNWLYKGFKENIMVDVIFKSKGDIYLDSEMYQRMITAEFHGKQVRLVAPEDLIIIKVIAHGEVTPGHWHDALALLLHANIDWEHLIRRARRAPRRVLSLLIYAQSNDVWVPKHAIDRLYRIVFGDSPPKSSVSEAFVVKKPQLRVISRGKHNETLVAKLRECFAEDPRVHELDIQIEIFDNKLILRGEVLTVDRREAITEVAKEVFPAYEIENQIRVSSLREPSEVEEIR